MDGVSFFWLLVCFLSKKFCSRSTPPPQIIEIFNFDSALTLQNCKFYSIIQACYLKVLLNVRQCLFCHMRKNSARVILPLDEYDWLKWLHDKFGTHDLFSWPRHLQWLSLRCMNEFCHGFSTGKFLAASFLHCVNYSLNPNHKSWAFTPHSKSLSRHIAPST